MSLLSIILPTYNESKNLPLVLESIQKSLAKKVPFEVIVVDDNSPDKTWDLARKYKKDTKIRVIRRLNEKGLTSAISRGIKEAKGDLVCWMDVDLSHPPELLAQMVTAIKNKQAILASRYIPNAQDNRTEKVQVFLSFLINRVARFLLYSDITDYTSGYIMVRKNNFDSYTLQGDYGEYFINFICYLRRENKAVTETPFHSYSRQHGYSKTATNIWGLLVRGRKYVWAIGYNWYIKQKKKLFKNDTR